MQHHRTAWLIQGGILLLSARLMAATNLLPGLSYYPAERPLGGRLTFLYSDKSQAPFKGEQGAVIYQLDLQQTRLEKIADAPDGVFISSDNGSMYCVLYGVDKASHNFGTNAYLHSPIRRASCVLQLGRSPSSTIIIDQHFFFTLESANSEFLYFAALPACIKHQIEMPGASRWEHELFKNIRPGDSEPNRLYFGYHAFGTRKTGGQDYEPGVYAFDLDTGGVAPLSNQIAVGFPSKVADGRYAWFDGRGAPISGRRLVSSPLDYHSSVIKDPKGKMVKILKTFPKPPPERGAFWLEQVSPCRRYVLVRFSEVMLLQETANIRWFNTYYIVDVFNGRSTVLLKDETQGRKGAHMSHVRWISRLSDKDRE